MNQSPAYVVDDVLIVGAGPAGLTAGYILTKAPGMTVRILEADPMHVGGISRTESYKGFLFDIGGHRFFTKSKAVEDLWHEIMPHDFIKRSRISRIYYQRKFYSYPLRAVEALRNLGSVESLRCMASYIWSRSLPIVPAKSFADWVTNKFGARLFRIFFKTYTEKIWGMSCDEISADWAAQRIKGLNLSRAVWDAIRRSFGCKPVSCDGTIIKTLTETFYYPLRGPGMMWEAAASKIRARGGMIGMGLKAESFVWDEVLEFWTVTAVDINKTPHVFRAKQVISSAPLRDMVAAVVPVPETTERAKTLRYRDFITVAVMLGRTPGFNDNWIYVHDPDVKVGRVQNFGSWSPDMVPSAKQGCLGLEYFCFENDGLWNMQDSELVALGCRELKFLGLVEPSDITGGCVVRQPKAYPVYDDGYKETVAAISDEFARRFPTMHFVGRNGMHKYNNQDHAMMTAMLAAENIMAGQKKFDLWQVNEDAEYHEEQSLRAVPERKSA